MSDSTETPRGGVEPALTPAVRAAVLREAEARIRQACVRVELRDDSYPGDLAGQVWVGVDYFPTEWKEMGCPDAIDNFGMNFAPDDFSADAVVRAFAHRCRFTDDATRLESILPPDPTGP